MAWLYSSSEYLDPKKDATKKTRRSCSSASTHARLHFTFSQRRLKFLYTKKSSSSFPHNRQLWQWLEEGCRKPGLGDGDKLCVDSIHLKGNPGQSLAE